MAGQPSRTRPIFIPRFSYIERIQKSLTTRTPTELMLSYRQLRKLQSRTSGEPGHGRVVKFDLTDCPEIDPGGLLLLMYHGKELMKQGWGAYLGGLGGTVKQVLLNLDHYLAPKEARASFEAPPGDFLLRGIDSKESMVAELVEWATSVQQATQASDERVALWQMQIAEVTTNGFQHGPRLRPMNGDLLINGMAYPARGEVQLAAIDFGSGIPRVIETIGRPSHCIGDGDLIAYACEKGVTSKCVPQNQGAGLDSLIQTATTDAFIGDVRARLLVVPTMSTDGFQAYPVAIGQSFEAVDYSVVQKSYSRSPRRVRDGQPSDHRYEPPRDPFITRIPVYGSPDMSQCSTSHVERANLTMRMQIRRFTRLCNGFSKKFENHVHHVALYFAWFNFCRVHETLRVTPAMEAGLTDHVWSMDELVRAALAEPAGDKPVKKPLRLPEVPAEQHQGAVRELPGGRGFLRSIPGGKAPPPSPAPSTPTPAAPAAAPPVTPRPTPAGLAAKGPRPMRQLSLFGEEDPPVV